MISSSTAFRQSLVVAVVVLAFLWRLPVIPAEKGVLFCDADSLFHLHRASQTATDFPDVRSVDAYAHFPAGYRPQWLAPLSVLYAAVLRVSRLDRAGIDRQAALLSWIPPVLGCVAVVLVVCIARRGSGWAAGLVAATLAAVDVTSSRPFFFGFIDHHMFAVLASLVLVLARLRRDVVLWFAGLAVALATTPEATPLVLVFLVVVASSEIIRSAAGLPAVARFGWWLAAPSVVGFSVLAMERAFETEPLPLRSLSWFHYTAFQPMLLALVAFALGGTLHWAEAKRESRPAGDRVVGLVLLCGTIVGLYVLFVAAGAFEEMAGRLLHTDRMVVTEERLVAPLWSSSAWLQLMSVGGVASLGWFVASIRSAASSEETFLWAAFMASYALGFTEMRWLRVVNHLEMAGIAVVAFRTLELSQSTAVRAIAAAAGAAVLAWIVVWPNVRDRAALHGDYCGDRATIEEAAAWFADRAPASESVAPWGVVGPWAWGHSLHVLGRVPVVFDPFNNRYEDRRQMIEALRDVWWTRTAADLHAALAKYGARYLILFDPFVDITDALGSDPSLRSAFWTPAPNGGVALGDALSRFAAFRLFMSRGLGPEAAGLELEFASLPVEIRRVDRGGPQAIRLPRVQIYGVRRGATIQAPTAPETTCAIAFDVQWSGGETEHVDAPAPRVNGVVRYETALPAPYRGHGFEVTTPYSVACGDWRREATISDDAVERGDVVVVN